MGAQEWTWGQAINVFFVGFGGVFLGLVILMIATNLYSWAARQLVKMTEKPKQEEQKA